MTAKLTGSITRRDGSANLYYRRSLPRKVRHRFGGKAEVWRSLGTTDMREAAARALQVGLDLQRIIDDALSLTPLSSSDFGELAHRLYNLELETYERRRRALPTATERQEAEAKLFSTDFSERLEASGVLHSAKLYREQREILRAELKKHFQEETHVLVSETARIMVEDMGKSVDVESPIFQHLCEALMRTWMEALDRSFERDQGNYSGKPSDPVLTQAAAKSLPGTPPQRNLGELFDEFVNVNKGKLAPETLTLYRDVVRLFRERVGLDAGPKALTKENVREWRNDLRYWPTKAAQRSEFKGCTFTEIVQINRFRKLPAITPKTVKKYLSAIGGFSTWLVREGYIDVNPVTNLYPEVGEATMPRHSFSPEELQQLVGLLVELCDEAQVPCAADIRGDAERVWAPLISMFSGARMGEILQLRPDDVREKDGIWYFDIVASSSDSTRALTRLKTRSSRRQVPVHSTLIDLGILNIIAEAKNNKRQRLFPNVRIDAKGSLTGHYSKWFRKLLRKQGMRAGVVFHSLRHTVADALRRAGVMDIEAALILGHALSAEARLMTKDYGELTQGTMTRRKELVEAISYPGLELARLMGHTERT